MTYLYSSFELFLQVFERKIWGVYRFRTTFIESIPNFNFSTECEKSKAVGWLTVCWWSKRIENWDGVGLASESSEPAVATFPENEQQLWRWSMTGEHYIHLKKDISNGGLVPEWALMSTMNVICDLWCSLTSEIHSNELGISWWGSVWLLCVLRAWSPKTFTKDEAKKWKPVSELDIPLRLIFRLTYLRMLTWKLERPRLHGWRKALYNFMIFGF